VKPVQVLIIVLAVLADVAFALWYFGFFSPPPASSSSAVTPPQFRASFPPAPSISP
jgi:hypothetical protein